MSLVRFENVTFGYSTPLFKDVSFTINEGDRIGIVGNNGCGKSTLFKCLMGLIEPSEGLIVSQKGLKFGFIEQGIPHALKSRTLYDVISDAIPADDRMHMSWKVDIALDMFNAPHEIRQKPVEELSGGWQRLALIARVALSESGILLLDEPTNHLDVAKILVLEQWLNEQVYDVPILCISHDRSFLANCTRKTLFLRGTQVHEYSHPYERAVELLVEDEEALSSRREKELKEMNRLKRSAHELRQIGVNNYSAAALKKSIQIAKRAEGIATQLTEVHIEAKRDLKLSNSGTHAKILIGVNKLNVLAPDNTLLFHIDELSVMQGERLVIFGKNGCGKSQFLHLLNQASQDIESAKARGIFITPSVELAYIDQQMAHLPLNRSLHDYFAMELSQDTQKTTSILVGAGFPVTIQQTELGRLSHGQRARVAFLALRLKQPNFYLMDEPTNHLDIAGQEQLESEILNQGATCVLVSHDRTFAQQIGTAFYVIADKKLVRIQTPDRYYKDIHRSD